MENTRENTRLLAGFDPRVKKAGLLQIEFINPMVSPEDGAVRTDWQIADTCYHLSWDWLMPVIHKIGDINFGEVHGLEDKINELFPHDVNYLFTPIEYVYGKVVDFIEWYNTNK